jgi:iron complex outermembrane receptor protein
MFRKISLTLLIPFISFSILFAQSAEKKDLIIPDDEGAPIPGATVKMEGEKGVLYTSEGGVVTLPRPENDTVKLEVSSLGNADLFFESNWSSLPKSVKLSYSPILSEGVMVTAVRVDQNSPFTYENIDREEIEKENLGQDLPYLLEQSTSAVVTSDAGAGVGYTGIRIRGTDASRINVTINGIPYNDAESQGTFWVNLPDIATSTDNIQIQRGVGTSTNGGSAFGASISLQTNEVKKKPYGVLSNSIGSFNTMKNTVALGTGLINDRFSFDARLSRIESDGYIDRASSNLKSLYLSGGYHYENTSLTFNYFTGSEVTYQAWYGVFEDDLDSNRTINYAGTEKAGEPYDREVDDYRQDHYQLHFEQHLGSGIQLGLSLHYTRGKGFFEQYKAGEFLPDYGIDPVVNGNDTTFYTDLIRRRWLDNHFYGIVGNVRIPHNQGLLTIGGGWNQYDGDHYGDIIWARSAGDSEIRDRFYDNNGLKTDFHLYAKEDYKLFSKLNLLLDFQYRMVGYNTDGVDIDGRDLQGNHVFHFFNPKVGLNYSIGYRQDVYASFALAHREPTRNDFIDAEGTVPEPEVLRNLEIGYRYSGKKLAFNANYYLMHYKNQLVLTGELNDVGTPIRTNVDRSYRTGIELSGSYKAHSKFRVDANVTFSVNKIDEFTETVYTFDPNYNRVDSLTISNTYENTDISFSPSWIGAVELTYIPVPGLEIASINKFVGEQFMDNTMSEDRKLDRYYQSDIRFSYSVAAGFFKEIRFNLLFNNITDKLYESNGYTFRENYVDGTGSQSGPVTYNYYYPQAGFNVLVGLDLRF